MQEWREGDWPKGISGVDVWQGRGDATVCLWCGAIYTINTSIRLSRFLQIMVVSTRESTAFFFFLFNSEGEKGAQCGTHPNGLHEVFMCGSERSCHSANS